MRTPSQSKITSSIGADAEALIPLREHSPASRLRPANDLSCR
jgi:hypothetical protein